MPGTHTELLLAGVDPTSMGDSPRLVCWVETGGKLVLWGARGNTQHIDAVLEAGFPCLIACDWEDPPIWAQATGDTYWVAEDAYMRVLSR